ncbi:hypothetical protein HW450_06705 [Corynebacterium hindlerae]|uniref:Uncharacterized protein n=1 Tax=Corynebacterium hindlerae TaxID=699041 RepID=A0A7G5FBU1_9CORY|nr:hypothetical protein [Corynebacterium hindlerae]QMV84082.1 hypothetical protein HW450_06705 [Corynebacterium hindlerae]
MSTKIDLNTITFTPAPHGFDQSGSMMGLIVADLEDGRQIIAGYDINSGKASIALGDTSTGPWADSITTKDWPALDAAFGRAQWQEFLADLTEEAEAELAETED